MKCLEGILVDSKTKSRRQIRFDENTGLILDMGDLKIPREKIDYYFDDDCLVFAGMGDIHVHAREDVSQKHIYKEDFLSASKAALNGGVTHICDMPNNPIPPVDDKTYADKLKLTKRGLIPILLYAGIGPNTRPLSYMVPYKAYIGPSIGDLFFRSNKELDDVLKFYKGQHVSFHCEDPEILEEKKGEKSHLKRRPVEAEVVATKTAIDLIEKYNLQGKLCHFSSSEGMEKIRAARSRGTKILCEVTPQHLFFNDETIPENRKTFFQMNPPIRPKSEQEAMLKALFTGEIDFLATDHAPHSIEEKDQGISGLTGLDTYGAFVTWLLVEKKMDPRLAAKVCSENPGNFVNQFLPSLKKIDERFGSFGNGFGKLEKGFYANFTVLNLKKPTLVSKEKLKTKVSWSPFEGITFPGSVSAVFLGGKLNS